MVSPIILTYPISKCSFSWGFSYFSKLHYIYQTWYFLSFSPLIILMTLLFFTPSFRVSNPMAHTIRYYLVGTRIYRCTFQAYVYHDSLFLFRIFLIKKYIFLVLFNIYIYYYKELVNTKRESYKCVWNLFVPNKNWLLENKKVMFSNKPLEFVMHMSLMLIKLFIHDCWCIHIVLKLLNYSQCKYHSTI